MIEVEQKFRMDDVATLQQRVKALSARQGEPTVQLDRYFAHPCRDFSQTDEALRVRRVGRQNCVTYKGPKLDATTKTRREIELILPPGDAGAEAFADLLQVLGFREVGTVRKTRTAYRMTWQGHDVAVCCDEVDGLGSFVELEIGASEEGVDGAKAALAALAEELQLSGGERRSYLELLMTTRQATE